MFVQYAEIYIGNIDCLTATPMHRDVSRTITGDPMEASLASNANRIPYGRTEVCAKFLTVGAGRRFQKIM